jgi:hypothetical protein
MIKAAIDSIIKLRDEGTFKTFTHKGNTYGIEFGKFKPIIEDQPGAVQINTLTGIAGYLEAEPPDNLLGVHIGSHCRLDVLGKLQRDNHNDRWTYLTSTAIGSNFVFGKYYSVNDFIINLQTCFVQTDVTAKILKVVGTVTDKHVKTLADDGVTQYVTVKSGIERVAEISLPNPVLLGPYRTFSEITQPESPFVFRMLSGSAPNEWPKCGLFEADNGLWKLEAMGFIHEYLNNILPEGVLIIR